MTLLKTKKYIVLLNHLWGSKRFMLLFFGYDLGQYPSFYILNFGIVAVPVTPTQKRSVTLVYDKPMENGKTKY